MGMEDDFLLEDQDDEKTIEFILAIHSPDTFHPRKESAAKERHSSAQFYLLNRMYRSMDALIPEKKQSGKF